VLAGGVIWTYAAWHGSRHELTATS
jgi:hypothetical protein